MYIAIPRKPVPVVNHPFASSNGAIIHQGPSQLPQGAGGGRPVAAILTGLTHPSANAKTGPMLQLWIIPQDFSPSQARRRGLDSGVCGSCPLRPSAVRSNAGAVECYVSGRELAAIWRAFKAGRYPVLDSLDDIRRLAAGRPVRLGAWGDPAALPRPVVETLCQSAGEWTGYTHCWRPWRYHWLRSYVMASVESQASARMAEALGWRAFLIVRPGEEPPADTRFANCPASAEAGHRAQCLHCLQCDGASRKAPHIWTFDHGPAARRLKRQQRQNE